MSGGLPAGFGLVLDRRTRVLDGGRVLLGGSPRRALRLSPAGVAAFARLRADGHVSDERTGRLARRLVDAGVAHPRPPVVAGPGVTVIVPVRDRAVALDRCLAALTGPGEVAGARESAGGGVLAGAGGVAGVRALAGAGEVAPSGEVAGGGALAGAGEVPRGGELTGTGGVAGAPGGVRVLVVDDGSDDPAAVAEVAARYGARLIRRPVSGGPAAARNTGLAAMAAGGADGLVAFVDSDCVPSPGWLQRLAGHFADPAVVAVAPRIVPLVASAAGPVLSAFAAARSPLDLGPDEALVRPGSRVSYVPTAALLVRRSALDGFDEALRYGEDVDAVWRLVAAGGRVRYDPSVTVAHAEPASWPAWLRRRHHYGTSAGPLDRRHPGRLAPLVVAPWPAAVTALLLARRPVLATAAGAVAAVRLASRLRADGLPPSLAAPMIAEATAATLTGAGRAVAQLALPAVVAAAAATGRRRRPVPVAAPAATVAATAATGRRRSRLVAEAALVAAPAATGRRRRLVTVAVLVAAPAVRDWLRLRPSLDPVRWTLASIADDVAYGTGVWRGAVRARTARPLLPVGRKTIR